MTMQSRYLLSAALALALAGAPAAFAQDKPMDKDSMGKTEKTDKMDKMDKMEKSDGMKKTDGMKKKTDGMKDTKKDNMSDGMKKY